MFAPGDRIHLHDGRVVTVGPRGGLGKARRRRSEALKIRGFVRGALVDVRTGEQQLGDWHENVICVAGHQNVINCFAGFAGSTQPKWFAVGYHTEAQSSNFSTQSALQSEYGTNSASDSNTGFRASITDNGGTQQLSGTWTLTQTHQYAATHISHGVSINAVGLAVNSSVATGSLLSIATFAASSKGTTQALNLTYNWMFST